MHFLAVGVIRNLALVVYIAFIGDATEHVKHGSKRFKTPCLFFLILGSGGTTFIVQFLEQNIQYYLKYNILCTTDALPFGINLNGNSIFAGINFRIFGVWTNSRKLIPAKSSGILSGILIPADYQKSGQYV